MDFPLPSRLYGWPGVAAAPLVAKQWEKYGLARMEAQRAIVDFFRGARADNVRVRSAAAAAAEACSEAYAALLDGSDARLSSPLSFGWTSALARDGDFVWTSTALPYDAMMWQVFAAVAAHRLGDWEGALVHFRAATAALHDWRSAPLFSSRCIPEARGGIPILEEMCRLKGMESLGDSVVERLTRYICGRRIVDMVVEYARDCLSRAQLLRKDIYDAASAVALKNRIIAFQKNAQNVAVHSVGSCVAMLEIALDDARRLRSPDDVAAVSALLQRYRADNRVVGDRRPARISLFFPMKEVDDLLAEFARK